MSVSLSKKEQNNLIKKIPDGVYSVQNIHSIVKRIKDGRITSGNQFPESKTTKSKVDLESDTESDYVEPLKDKDNIPKKGLGITKKGLATLAEKERKKKEREDKKFNNAKLYYGAYEVPKYHRRASMLEAGKAKMISYWGVKKVDNKLLESFIYKPEKSLKESIIEMSGLIGKLNKIKKDIEFAKKSNNDYTHLTEAGKNAFNKVSKLNELINKLKKEADEINKKKPKGNEETEE